MSALCRIDDRDTLVDDRDTLVDDRDTVTDDRGTVTVEAALALCSLVLVLAMMLAAVSAVAAKLRCIDAAREAARLTARGEQDRGEQLARRLAPSGAVVQVHVRGDEVTARVSADSVGGLLPGVEITAESAAVLEPGLRS